MNYIIHGIFFVLILNIQSQAQNNNNHSQPNIVFIMADDLGYGDIGSYNEAINFTPNIDQLAKEGMRFTDFHSNGPMCSPSRAALMTGMYQQRLGERFESALSPRLSEKGLPSQVLTVADLLKSEGYKTGIFGKWHLGFEEPYLPINYGFDEFKGHLSGDGDYHTHINRWGMKDWWNNDNLKMDDGYNTDLITEYSTKFIEQHKNEPFFLYVPYLAIHFPWQGPEDPPHRKAGETYDNDKWGNIENEDNVRPHVVKMIKALDQGVGKIVAKLKELNIEGETLVIFTSDNGGYTNYYQNQYKFENISNNGPLRGQKTDVYEGGHRVPFIAYWPDKIKAGTESDETVMLMDMFPTFTELAGASIPEGYKIDGINILPTLLEGKSLPERILYMKIGNRWFVRKGPWKLVNNGNDRALFDLNSDLEESVDLSSDYPIMMKEFNYLFQEWKRDVFSDAKKWDN